MAANRKIDARYQNGLTLVEMMIALLIGTFLLIGTMTVFTQSRTNFRVADSMARLQENARFAMDVMEPDVRLAKFWGRNNNPGVIALLPGAVNVDCDTVDNSNAMVPPTTYSAWTLDFANDLWAVDESSGYDHQTLGIPCAPNGGAQVESDVLVIRHASAQPFAPDDGTIQVQTNLIRSEIFDDGIIPPGFDPALSQTHNVVVNIYYVDEESDLDEAMPSLRVKSLIDGGVHQDQELIAGVENMQVQLGVDTDGDGEVDRYVDADHDIINPTTGGTIDDAETIAVRLWLLFRAEARENGFEDNRQYLSPDPDVQITPCAAGPNCDYPDEFRRLAVTKTIFLRNTR